MELIDSYRHKGMRKKMVEEVWAMGIENEVVLKALENVPRHYFLDNAFLESAYVNKPFPIGKGQTISQPYTVAFQSQLLDIKKGDKILEIGTGSGYQACVLSELGARVYTIERHKSLSDKAKKLIHQMGYKSVQCFYGDGFEGLPLFAPFDKVIITAAAPEIPLKLIQQLKVGGFMIIPLGEGDFQQMKKLTKLENGDYETMDYNSFSFVPMLKGKEA